MSAYRHECKRHCNVSDYDIYLGSPAELVSRLIEDYDNGNTRHVVTLNPEIFQLSQRNRGYASLLAQAHIITADGIGICWALRAQEMTVPERITGVSLVSLLTEASQKHRVPLVVLGATDEIREQFENRALANGAEVVRGISPYLESTAAGVEDYCDQLPPRGVFLLAFGAPKQDFAARRLISAGHRGIFIGVGGAIDILSQPKNSNSLVAEKYGLHWLYRLVRYPTTRLRRQMSTLPAFAWSQIVLPVLKKKLLGAQE